MLLAILLGTCAGIMTGLTPGLHTNTVTFAALPLLTTAPFPDAAGFITAGAAAHSSLEHIPSTLAGVPDESSVLAQRPGIDALMDGRAAAAIHRGLTGATVAVTTAAALLPVVFMAGESFYTTLRPLLPIVLPIIAGVNLLSTRRPHRSLLLFLVAGAAGHHTLNGPTTSFTLLSVLTGLFAVPGLIDGIGQQIPPQDPTQQPPIELRNGIIGSTAGLLSGFLPGVGPSSVLFLHARLIPEDGWLPANAGINISDALFSLIAIETIGNPRSGAAIAVQMLGSPGRFIPALVGAILVGAGVSIMVGRRATPYLVQWVSDRSTTPFNTALLVALIALVVALTGLHGLGECLMFTGIGLTALRLHVEPRMLMGVLLVPVTVYFIQNPV